jgi:hypothetical protein
LWSFPLAVSKPRPPSNLVYGSKVDSDGNLLFGLGFSPDPAYSNTHEEMSFIARTQAHGGINPYYREFVCDVASYSLSDGHKRVAMDLPMEEYVEHTNGYKVHIEVAAVYRGVVSRYVSVSDNVNESCKIPVLIGEWLH